MIKQGSLNLLRLNLGPTVKIEGMKRSIGASHLVEITMSGYSTTDLHLRRSDVGDKLAVNSDREG